MVFPALALLLWWSPPLRPNTRWLVGGLAGFAVLRLLGVGTLANQVVNGWSVASAGIFLLVMLRTRQSALDGAILATLLGAGATLLWFFAFHLDPGLPVRETVHQLQEGLALVGQQSLMDPDQLDLVTYIYTHVALVLPALFMLIGVGAFTTTWRWYHIFAADPAGVPPTEFTEFRFSDRAQWLLVAGAVGLIAQRTGYADPGALWPLNLVVFPVGLYTLQGLAVLRARTGPLPLPLLFVGVALFLVLWFLFIPLLFGFGLSDTWHHFRRPTPPSGD